MPADGTPALNPLEAIGTIEAPPETCTETSRSGRPTLSRAWLIAWGSKGTLAVTDQALFAGAQFALNILLARWLTPTGYGAFALVYSVYLLGSAVHGALLVEPMIVFGSGRHFKMRRNYLGIVVRGHCLLTAVMSMTLFTAGFLIARLHSLPVGHALYALGLVLPFTLLVELTRRAFYVEMKPGHAAAGGALYFCVLIATAVGLRAGRLLTTATAIIAMGLASLLTASVQLVRLRSQWPRAAENLSGIEVASEHWNYGRWVLAAVFPSWTLLNLFYVVLPLWFGLKESGALKAIMNLAMPATHSLVAFGMLAMPLFVRHREGGGDQLMRRTVRRVAGLFIAGTALYPASLWLFRFQIINLLYGGKYLEYSGLPVLLVGLVPLVTACSVVFGAGLRACERPDRVFWANVAASFLSLTLGLWLTATWGVLGAIAGYVVSYGTLAGALWFLYQALRPDVRLSIAGVR